MRVIRYAHKKHLGIYQDWARQHGVNVPEAMPKIGCIAFEGRTPIAMGFLRRVEGGYAQFDGLISNPQALPSWRNAGIDLVSTKLLNLAKQLGIKGLVAMSADENTIMRSQRFGFVKLPHTYLAVNLNTGESK